MAELEKSEIGEKVLIKKLLLDSNISNVGEKFNQEDLITHFEQSLKKYLEKKQYQISSDSDLVIEGEFSKIDIGNRFMRYISMGFAGKVLIGISGRIKKGEDMLHEFDITVPYTSMSWIHTPRFLCSQAVKGCALKISKFFSKN